MSFTQVAPNLHLGSFDLRPGELAALWQDFDVEVIVGHPTLGTRRTIGAIVDAGVRGAAQNFAGRRVSLIITDGTYNRASMDTSVIDAAMASAREALDSLDTGARAQVQVVVTPYEGYAGDNTPGKGSALKLIYDEMEPCAATMLVLLDGDLRNEVGSWQGIFARLEQEHLQRHGGRPFIVTARYARHFVDASLTRFIVGPLSTLLGRYVPGAISGDIVLSAAAVAHERREPWTVARRKYGTDISTTFDNIADPETVVYEVFLGAKLHDITDEAKLSVMPGEVIGGALERLLYWERQGQLVTRGLEAGGELQPLELWGPERTGIGFIDPGHTDVFDVDGKVNSLCGRFGEYAEQIRAVLGPETTARLQQRVQRLQQPGALADEAPLVFLGVDRDFFVQIMQQAVAHALARGELEQPKRCLSYLYTAAFLEFVKDRLADLGCRTLGQVRQAQQNLGVPPQQAETFYTERVDRVARDLAMTFFERRGRILELMRSMA